MNGLARLFRYGVSGGASALIIDAENAGSRKVAERAGYVLARVDRVGWK